MSDVTLDADQRAAAEVAPETRQVVIASAGTGKTETVAALVDHLVSHEGVIASQGLLILSFSRAAVGALGRRLAGKDDALRATNVRTLDALAARIIASDEGAAEPTGSFDDRIEQAAKLVRREILSDELLAVEHVIVDEVQDVVGVRAGFVLEILRATRPHAGFSVLGDPQQAIYNFQLEGSGGMTSEQFLGYLDQQFAPKLRELETNYRAASDDARRFASLGPRLVGLSEKQRISTVRSELASVPNLADAAKMGAVLQRWSPGSTAFLCETNGIALTVRDALRADGAHAVLQSAAEQRGVAAWVAETIDGSATKVKRQAFVEAWDESRVLPAAEAWRVLKKTERNFKNADTLEVKRLARAVARRDVPAELMGAPNAEVIVSTVHRSKGLEFDNVALVNTAEWLPAGASNDDASEAYVALTRARDRVIAVRATLDRGLRSDKKSNRWIIGGFKSWQTFGFELRPSDTRTPEDPARAPAVREYVRESTAVGDDVDLRVNKTLSDLNRPVYDVLHQETRIGVTTEDFGHALARRLGSMYRSRRVWPPLKGLSIDGYETRGCGPELSVPGASDLWLGVVVTGMARLDWNSEDE